MTINLRNKTALVTGASRGIGKAIAIMFANAGADVIVHYNKNKSMAENTLNGLPNGNHMLIQANIADPDSVADMVNKVYSMGRQIDILVNNAGIYEEVYLLP